MTAFTKICRACNSEKLNLLNLFAHDCDDEPTLGEKFFVCTALNLNESDTFPQSICYSCAKSLETAYKFRKQCERSHNQFKKKILSLRKADGSVKMDVKVEAPCEDEEPPMESIYLDEDMGEDEINVQPTTEKTHKDFSKISDKIAGPEKLAVKTVRSIAEDVTTTSAVAKSHAESGGAVVDVSISIQGIGETPKGTKTRRTTADSRTLKSNSRQDAGPSNNKSKAKRTKVKKVTLLDLLSDNDDESLASLSEVEYLPGTKNRDKYKKSTVATYTIHPDIIAEAEGRGRCSNEVRESAYRTWLADDWDGLSNPPPKLDITYFYAALQSVPGNQLKLQKSARAHNNLIMARCAATDITHNQRRERVIQSHGITKETRAAVETAVGGLNHSVKNLQVSMEKTQEVTPNSLAAAKSGYSYFGDNTSIFYVPQTVPKFREY